MSVSDLCQRERDVLGALRVAVAARANREREIATTLAAARAQAASARVAAQRSAEAELKRAHRAREMAQAALRRPGLLEMLDATAAAPPRAAAESRPEPALAAAAAACGTAAAEVDRAVEALERWQEARARRRRWLIALGTLGVLLLVVLVGAGSYVYVTVDQPYRAAVAALNAGQWETARSKLGELPGFAQNYQSARTVLRESYYRPATQAMAAGQWSAARDQLLHLATVDSSYKDAPQLLEESDYQLARAALAARRWSDAADAFLALTALAPDYKDVTAVVLASPDFLGALARGEAGTRTIGLTVRNGETVDVGGVQITTAARGTNFCNGFDFETTAVNNTGAVFVLAETVAGTGALWGGGVPQDDCYSSTVHNPVPVTMAGNQTTVLGFRDLGSAGPTTAVLTVGSLRLTWRVR